VSRRISQFSPPARTGACLAARTARGFISSRFLAQRATEASRGRDSGSISISAGATVNRRELKLTHLSNSDLRLQTSDSEHETSKNVAFVLRHSFAIRHSCFGIRSMSFGESPRFRSSDKA